jgi:hypothetical protein
MNKIEKQYGSEFSKKNWPKTRSRLTEAFKKSMKSDDYTKDERESLSKAFYEVIEQTNLDIN